MSSQTYFEECLERINKTRRRRFFLKADSIEETAEQEALTAEEQYIREKYAEFLQPKLVYVPPQAYDENLDPLRNRIIELEAQLGWSHARRNQHLKTVGAPTIGDLTPTGLIEYRDYLQETLKNLEEWRQRNEAYRRSCC